VLKLTIALISRNRETLDGVQEYFRRVGARLSTLSELEDSRNRVSEADVVIIFADDYPQEAVKRAIVELSVQLIVIVTENINAYAPRPAKAGMPRVLVLTRPAWGWMLLDAVRSAVPTVAGRN
jgi:hypothetical protein